MVALLHYFVLSSLFAAGMVLAMEPHRRDRRYQQALEDLQAAAVHYVGNHCAALPGVADAAQLRAAGSLPAGFDDQGAVITWRLAAHPGLSINVRGNNGFQAFLAGRTLGAFEADGSYTFLPQQDLTFFRAANSSYNLLAYAGRDFSCDPL